MAQSEIIHDRKNGSIGPPRHDGAVRRLGTLCLQHSDTPSRPGAWTHGCRADRIASEVRAWVNVSSIAAIPAPEEIGSGCEKHCDVEAEIKLLVVELKAQFSSLHRGGAPCVKSSFSQCS